MSWGVSRGTIWRRRALAVGLLVALAAAVWVVVSVVDKAGSPKGFSDTHGADVEELEIRSKAVSETLPVDVVVPEGADDEARPLLVFLHGRGSGQDSILYDELFDALDAQGARAPVIAAPYGGEASYWHDRTGGAWGQWVVDEVIPRVQREFETDGERVAVSGISMGGFGALDLVRLNPGAFCAVGAHSPALWLSAEETAEGAFDDAEDFAAHDVVAAASTDPGPYLSQPVWVDAGDEDPFRPGVDAFADRLEAAGADLSFHIWPGAHETEYWRSNWDDYMRFYARALASC
jgi:S-formylglutathione hydrolase FrmB